MFKFNLHIWSATTIAEVQVAGIVDRSGNAIVSGEEFSCNRLQSGHYLISFHSPLPETAVPVATVVGSPWETFQMSVAIVNISPNDIVLVTSTPNQPEDCGFSFMVTY